MHPVRAYALEPPSSWNAIKHCPVFLAVVEHLTSHALALDRRFGSVTVSGRGSSTLCLNLYMSPTI